MGEGNDRQVNVRLDEEDRSAIDKLVDSGRYANVSAFIRSAIKERLDPQLRKTREMETFNEMLDDPEKILILKQKMGLK